MQDLRYPIGQHQPPAEITDIYLNDCIERIRNTPENLRKAVSGLDDTQLNTPYRPGGWTIRQLIHHVPDSHINSYVRFHWALSEEKPLIKAYDEKSWAELPYQEKVPVEVSLQLLTSVHARWVILMENLDETALNRSFVHPDDGKTYPLREVIPMYAWHGDHHVAHITSLRERNGW